MSKKDYEKECPKCHSDDLAINKTNGFECRNCGCWYGLDDEGRLDWAYASAPLVAFLN